MYKCLGCNAVFEELKITTRHDGSPYLPDIGCNFSESVCPECGNDDYEEAKQCDKCKEYFHCDDNFYNGWCYECAKDEFTLEFGMEYLQARDIEKEFYVDVYFNTKCEIVSEELFMLCKETFMHVAKKRVKAQGKLSDWIFTEMTDWIDWLNEKSEAVKNGNAKAV